MQDVGLYVQIGTTIAGAGVIYGMMKTKIQAVQDDIKRLELKQDKHNGLIERMVVVEQSCKSFHHRLDALKKED